MKCKRRSAHCGKKEPSWSLDPFQVANAHYRVMSVACRERSLPSLSLRPYHFWRKLTHSSVRYLTLSHAESTERAVMRSQPGTPVSFCLVTGCCRSSFLFKAAQS